MPLKIKNFTIRLPAGSHLNRGALAYIWKMFLDQHVTDIHVFVTMIQGMIAVLSADELLSLVINCSLVAKVNRLLKLKALWGRDPYFSALAVRYLLGSFSRKKPLIIGFIAFLQLCRLRLHNRSQSAYFTVEHIEFVEVLKSALQESIFEPNVMSELIKQQKERQGAMFYLEIPDFMNRFGWFSFAHYYMYIGEFDNLPFKFLTAG
jgi:hypothetical protein